MSWRSIQEILDYEYCPKYWTANREHRFQQFHDLPVSQLLERFENRLKVYKETQKTKRVNANYKKKRKRKSKRKRESTVPALIVGTILTMVLFYYNLIYFLFFLFAMILFAFLYFRYRKNRHSVSPGNDDVHLLLEKELKSNPQLILLDPPSSPYSNKTNVFGEIPNIKRENGRFVVTIDRSDFTLPRYAQFAPHRDLIELIFYMYLIHTNFFTTNITGIVQYHNDTRKIEWSDNNLKKGKSYIDKNKIKKSLAKIGKINEAIKKYSSHQNIKPHFGRCAQCPLLKQGCRYASRYHKLQIPKNFNEDTEKTYLKFKNIYSQLERTTWHHWKDQIQTFVRFIHLSPTIKKHIMDQVSESKIYDIDAMIDTAIFNQNELYNGHFFSNIENRSFSYQLLLYLSKVGKNRLKPLMAAYGQTKNYDYKTSYDVKINNFIKKTILLSEFVLGIGAMLEEHLEKNKTDKNNVVYNYFRQTLKIEHNKGTIIQPTIKTNVDIADEEQGE